MATVDPPGRLTRWVIAPVLIGLAVTVGVIGLHGARDATDYGYQAAVEHIQDPGLLAEAGRFRSITNQVRDRIPRGAKVFIPQAADRTDVFAVEWEQRLPEIALMQGDDVVNDPAQAEYELHVVRNGVGVTLVVAKVTR